MKVTPFNTVVQHVSKSTRLVHVPNGGQSKDDISARTTEDVIVVAMPAAPWYKVPGREAYGSRDTLTEVVVAKEPKTVLERVQILEALVMLNCRHAARLDNDVESFACMHMTKDVPINLLDVRSGDARPLKSGNNEFYVLVAAGEEDGGLFLVDELWYSETQWCKDLPEVQKANERSAQAVDAFLQSNPATSPDGRSGSQVHISNVGAAAGDIQVYHVSADLTTRTPIGFAVGFPQYCRKHLNGREANTYGSPEWFKELIVTPDQKDIVPARKWLPVERVANEAGTVACAHVSKSVPVSKLTRDGTGGWKEDRIGDNGYGFFTLVATGAYENPIDDSGMFQASEIWIGEQPWPTTAKVFKDAMARSATSGSACS